jgi:hypothetical protein
VADADERGIKLTIMLTAQWSDYIADNPSILSRVQGWEANGHELAGHHHSVYHPGNWDGYSDFNEEERRRIRGLRDRTLFAGTLDDWTERVQRTAPNVSSGCSNGETDKSTIPRVVVNDSCPGFYTTDEYPFGTRSEGGDPLGGRNDFVLVGTSSNGVERRFLGHTIITGRGFLDGATDAFDQMTTGAYGVIIHTNPADINSVRSWMDHVVSSGAVGGSSTLSGIIESGVLPERTLDSETFNTVYDDE